MLRGSGLRAVLTKNDQRISKKKSVSQMMELKVMVSYPGVNEETQMRSYICLIGDGSELELETTFGWL